MPTPATPIPFDSFGGRVTLIDRTDLQGPGASPSNRNVVYAPGRVGKRPGTTSLFTAISGSPSVVAIHSVRYDDGIRRRFLLSSNGSLWYETPPGTLALQQGNYGTFQRGYFLGYGTSPIFLFGDGYDPVTRPIRWTGETVIKTGAFGQVGGVLGPIQINSNGSGSVTAGVHKVVFVYEGKDGAWSAPTSHTEFTASGTDKYQAVNSYDYPVFYYSWLHRHMFMTAAGGAIYYYLGLADGGGPWDVTATDAYLLSQTRLDYPVNYTLNISPPSCAAAFGPINGRIWLAKPRAALGKSAALFPSNLDLQTLGTLSAGMIAGWTVAAPTANVTCITDYTAAQGGCWRFTADGSATPASINTPMPSEVRRSSNLLACGTVVRARRSAGLVAGSLAISMGVSTPVKFTAAQLTTEWKSFDTGAVLYPSLSFPGIVISITDTPTSGQYIEVELNEPYVGTQPVYRSTYLVSDPSGPGQFFDPDSYFSVDEGDGDEVSNVFDLAGARYVTKHRALYRVTDDGGPACYWTYQKIAVDVGTPSFQGVGLGEGFAVICGRSGAWLFMGGGILEEANLTKEILPDWQAINWDYGHLIWCRVDTERKLVFIGVPLGSATEVSSIYVLDYMEGWHSSVGTTSAYVTPTGRKWTIWDVGASCAEFVEMDDGTRQFWLGNGSGTGKIYKLDDAAYSDDGTAIDSWYECAPVGVAPGPNLVTRLLMDVHGSGALEVSLLDYPGDQTILPYSPTLNDPSRGLTQIMAHFISEKASVKIRNLSADQYWTLCKLVQYVKPWRGSWGRPLNP